MRSARWRLKAGLLRSDGRPPPCPLDDCGRPATQLHELIPPPHKGSKYDLGYPEELVILLCPDCNVHKANNRQKDLLAIQVNKYGKDRVEAALDSVRSQFKVAKYRVPNLD